MVVLVCAHALKRSSTETTVNPSCPDKRCLSVFYLLCFKNPLILVAMCMIKGTAAFPIPEHLPVGGPSACLCKVYGTCSVLTCLHLFCFSWESSRYIPAARDASQYFLGSHMISREYAEYNISGAFEIMASHGTTVYIVPSECLNIYGQVLKSVTVSQSQFSLCTYLYNNNCCAQL